jgi:hypothetical protein
MLQIERRPVQSQPVQEAQSPHPQQKSAQAIRPSILARAAWLRLLLVLPACMVLWLGVRWALAGDLG